MKGNVVKKNFATAAAVMVLAMTIGGAALAGPRARDAGVVVGILEPGPLNGITDVEGVRVGQVTLVEGTKIHTGVTAILPHGGNIFQDKVPAGFVAENAFGKFMGSTQVAELGEVETPILLTNTLNVADAGIAAVEWTLSRPGNEEVRSVNAVVGETNDGFLNDIRGRHVTVADARRAVLERARASLEHQEATHHLLSIALDHCTIGQALVGPDGSAADPDGQIREAGAALDLSIETMRRASKMEFLPILYLTRARHRRTRGDPTGARADLEAAVCLATPSGMRTDLAECALLAGQLDSDLALGQSAMADRLAGGAMADRFGGIQCAPDPTDATDNPGSPCSPLVPTLPRHCH